MQEDNNTVANVEVNDNVAAEQSQEQQQEQQEAKTFTQEEVNKIVSDRVNKEKSKMPSKEELDSFRTWQESQKTEQEKQQERITQYEEKIKQLESDKFNSNIENTLVKNNVKEKFYDVVKEKFKGYQGEDLNTEINNYLEQYPEFKQQEQQQLSTGKRVEQINTEDSRDKDYLSLLGLKPEDIK